MHLPEAAQSCGLTLGLQHCQVQHKNSPSPSLPLSGVRS